MNKYKVKITELLQTTVMVEADNADSAGDMVRSMYRNSEIVLTADNYVHTEFTVVGTDISEIYKSRMEM